MFSVGNLQCLLENCSFLLCRQSGHISLLQIFDREIINAQSFNYAFNVPIMKVFSPYFFKVGQKVCDKKIFRHFSDRTEFKKGNCTCFLSPSLSATTSLSGIWRTWWDKTNCRKFFSRNRQTAGKVVIEIFFRIASNGNLIVNFWKIKYSNF